MCVHQHKCNESGLVEVWPSRARRNAKGADVIRRTVVVTWEKGACVVWAWATGGAVWGRESTASSIRRRARRMMRRAAVFWLLSVDAKEEFVVGFSDRWSFPPQRRDVSGNATGAVLTSKGGF